MRDKLGFDGFPDSEAFEERVQLLSPEDAMPELRQRISSVLAGESAGDVDGFIEFTLAVAGVESGTPEATQTLVHILNWSRKDLLCYFAEFQLYQDPGGVELELAHARSMSAGDESDESEGRAGGADGSYLDTGWEPDEPDESWRSSL